MTSHVPDLRAVTIHRVASWESNVAAFSRSKTHEYILKLGDPVARVTARMGDDVPLRAITHFPLRFTVLQFQNSMLKR
mgnify:CR=1 FL=1